MFSEKTYTNAKMQADSIKTMISKNFVYVFVYENMFSLKKRIQIQKCKQISQKTIISKNSCIRFCIRNYVLFSKKCMRTFVCYTNVFIAIEMYRNFTIISHILLIFGEKLVILVLYTKICSPEKTYTNF